MDIPTICCLKRFAAVYPGGNTTGVIFDDVSKLNLKELNARILESWKRQFPELPEVEQCCYVTRSLFKSAIARVQMLGGEFCANATRAVVELMTKEQMTCDGFIEVSGVSDPLKFKKRNGLVYLQMPGIRQGDIKRVDEGRLIDFGGIMQLVLRRKQNPRKTLTRLLTENMYGLKDRQSVGVASYDVSSGSAMFAVWVRDVDTMFDETACGSGTCAVAIGEFLDCGKTKVSVVQPTGALIRVCVQIEDDTLLTSVSGKVGVLYEGGLNLQGCEGDMP